MDNLIIGVNLFKPNIRQELCIQSLVKLQRQYPFIDLVNLQFASGEDLYEDPRIPTKQCLTKMSKDIVGDKTMPIVKEFFDSLSDMGYPAFCFTNNDIIISNRLIELFLNSDYDCYPVSRLAIEPIESLDDKIVGSHYQAVGFDTYIIKTNWWKDHYNMFRDYIAGQPQWDVAFATIMKLYGNTLLVNDWPPKIFHIIHEAPWTTTAKDTPENKWNLSLFNGVDKKYADIWWRYVYNVPLKRGYNYWYPLPNERELEDKYFNL